MSVEILDSTTDGGIGIQLPTSAKRQSELLALLEHVGPLREETIVLPGSGERMRIRRPSDFDTLLDQATDDPEQNLPYWAELWPSGIALAAVIARGPGPFDGKRTLELGCGLGVTAIAALRGGADLLVTDYSPEALAFCALNALDQTGREPDAMQLNWRDPGDGFHAAVGTGFPVVLAADVLYEARDVQPLLRLAERIVSPDGGLWLAEPGRKPAGVFLAAAHQRGWRIESEQCNGPWPDPEDNRKEIVVRIHRMTRS